MSENDPKVSTQLLEIARVNKDDLHKMRTDVEVLSNEVKHLARVIDGDRPLAERLSSIETSLSAHKDIMSKHERTLAWAMTSTILGLFAAIGALAMAMVQMVLNFNPPASP